MAQFWTEDPSIGNALAGLADSFSYKSQLAAANSLEDLKKKREEAAARARAGNAASTVLMAQQPPTVAPQAPYQEAWVNSSGQRGSENVPLVGGLPSLRAFTPDITAADERATAAAQAQRNAEFDRVRAKQIADQRLGYDIASNMGDVATNAPKMEANATLDMYGVPKTYEDQVKMQTQLTGQLPMLDVKGTTNNYAIRDPEGNIVAQGTTRDGRNDLTTGKPIVAPPGHSVVKMGDLAADQSPFKDEGARLAALAQLTRKATIGAQPLSLDEQQRAGIILANQFPNVQKVEKDDAGNIRIVRYDEKVAPSVYAPLIAQLNAGLGVRPTQQAPAQPAPTVPPPAPAPGVTTGPMPASPAAPAPADTKPIVPAGALAPNTPAVSAPIVQGSGDTQLKEVLNHPAVKGAIDAGRAYNELLAASQAKTPEADLHMIYMLAKIYDPNSVVREGEVATAANTSPAMEKWWGLYNKQVNAQSALSDRARASFIEEGYKAAQAHYAAAQGLIKYAGERAGGLGLNPQNVMPPLTAPQRQGPAPAAAAPAAARGGGGGQTVVLDGKRYTKNPDGSFSGPY
jgi:hypothetical protein